PLSSLDREGRQLRHLRPLGPVEVEGARRRRRGEGRQLGPRPALPPPESPVRQGGWDAARSHPQPEMGLLQPGQPLARRDRPGDQRVDRKSTRLNSSHEWISYAVFCLKKKRKSTPAR